MVVYSCIGVWNLSIEALSNSESSNSSVQVREDP